MLSFEVGKLYNPAVTKWPESYLYRFTEGHHELLLFVSKPTREEIAGVRSGRKEFAILTHGPALFLLMQTGLAQSDKAKAMNQGRYTALPWADAPFSLWKRFDRPTEQVTGIPELPQKPSETEKYVLQVMLVDAETGLLHAIVAVTLPTTVTQALYDAIEAQSRITPPPSPADVDAAIAEAYRFYPSPPHMAQDASARGIGGS